MYVDPIQALDLALAEEIVALEATSVEVEAVNLDAALTEVEVVALDVVLASSSMDRGTSSSSCYNEHST